VFGFELVESDGSPGVGRVVADEAPADGLKVNGRRATEKASIRVPDPRTPSSEPRLTAQADARGLAPQAR
jgi:hypothetical protein